EPNAHILVDARTGILDQVPAEHVHGLTYQVSQAEHSEVNTGSLHDRAGSQALSSLGIDRVNQLAHEDCHRRVAGAGEGHDQQCAAQSPPMMPGHEFPDLTATSANLTELAPDSS